MIDITRVSKNGRFRYRGPHGQVRLDNCHDRTEGAVLVEAKVDNGNLLGVEWSKAETSIPDQGQRQNDVAKTLGLKNEWHIQTAKDHNFIKESFKEERLPTPILLTPMPIIEK